MRFLHIIRRNWGIFNSIIRCSPALSNIKLTGKLKFVPDIVEHYFFLWGARIGKICSEFLFVFKLLHLRIHNWRAVDLTFFLWDGWDVQYIMWRDRSSMLQSIWAKERENSVYLYVKYVICTFVKENNNVFS